MSSSQQATRALGKNGPQVGEIGLGLMGLDFAYGTAPPLDEKVKFLEEAYESGARNWDSAALYAGSEATLGAYFKKHPDHRQNIFLATKFAVDPKTFKIDSSPEECKRSFENSIKTMGVDYVDLFYCHRVDKVTPIEKTVEAMHELQKAGKVKYLGLSEISAATLRRAVKVAPIACVQVEYSAFALDIEHAGLLDACRELGVAVVAYSPLGRGMLTGQYKSPSDFDEGDFRRSLPRYSEEHFPKNLQLVEKITKIGQKHGATAGQISLAWLLAQGNDIIPIPGTKKIKYLKENLGAADIKLSSEEVAEIRKAVEDCDVQGGRYGAGMEEYCLADTPELK